MKQIKTFVRLCNNKANDDEVNEFLSIHNVKNVKTDILQGFTYTSDSNYMGHIDSTFKPSIITTIVYEIESN